MPASFCIDPATTWRRCLVACAAVLLLVVSARGEPPRATVPLDGVWQFRRESDTNWKTVGVPTAWEHHESDDFDGTGVYRRLVPGHTVAPQHRLLLHFQAIATHAAVSVNGHEVGTHLGAWTPFRCDVTAVWHADADNVIEVRVDERVGHNTQGFLPIIAPHFGGIWQGVSLVELPATWIDDLSLLAIGDPETQQLRLELAVCGSREVADHRCGVRYRLRGATDWSAPHWQPLADARELRDAPSPADTAGGPLRRFGWEVPLATPQLWCPGTPAMYELEVTLETPAGRDQITTRAAFRTIKSEGRSLQLNHQPLAVRGLLNWGYAPPDFAPSLDEAWMRSELELARQYGCNLMKFCLWVPPRRYLELADELGVLTWIEYPTWHPDFSPQRQAELVREYGEFFRYDRNHPSVILRSLTCETGQSADLEVIRALYDQAHRAIPGCLVEDDSSWIQWHRVHDFYDDHPYGNNHTWPATLDRLNRHIAEREPKPLVLGEAIAADTWSPPGELVPPPDAAPPYWFPLSHTANAQWLERMTPLVGGSAIARLVTDSRHYALLMRKYQVEAFRRKVPQGGYVLSVIRDFPLAAMGFVDYLGRPKWPAVDWAWHGETICLLETPGDQRSFAAGQPMPLKLSISHFGSPRLPDGTWRLALTRDLPTGQPADPLAEAQGTTRPLAPGDASPPQTIEFSAPAVTEPTRFLLRAVFSAGTTRAENAWPIWVFPEPPHAITIVHHASFPEARTRWPTLVSAPWDGPGDPRVVLTRRLDPPLLDHLSAGGRVIVLPDGSRGSFPLQDHWFLRGGPVVAEHPLVAGSLRDALVELQHFDLADRVIPQLEYLDEIVPILLLWDNHDLRLVKTHGLLFEARCGQGRLAVSALNHTERPTPAGDWLLARLAQHVAVGPEPTRGFSDASQRRMREKFDDRQITLADRPWHFRPDPENRGVELGWSRPPFQPNGWEPLRIDRHWEGQGHAALDGWAWYRLQYELPQDWTAPQTFLVFTGADDYYELFVGGERVGSGGDIATRRTAFEEIKSHDVTRLVRAGQPLNIAVRVYDWYGAGGIFRPIYLRTTPLGDGPEVLR